MGMKQIESTTIKRQLNNCYDDYDPHWEINIDFKGKIDTSDSKRGFKYYLEQTGGIRLDFEVKNSHKGSFYKINSVEIVDEGLFTMWMLRWS